ncbi:G-protein coupled receptor Mth2 [Danaus plexippus plexippus]|uniref:G-protein coupled receptor Mth2 n=1 Tax=Danaus plexippus plexippus TaxID=278856 RepID=A0A212ETW6_DANPL|nr:G-protein coupled receptor Mth2 [Danaus plexippus plexippus]
MPVLLLLSAFFFTATSADFSNDLSDVDNVFRKCCPRGQNLVKVLDFNETISEYFECVDRGGSINLFKINSEPLYVSESVKVNHGIPLDCRDLQMTTIVAGDELVPLADNCYDRLVAEVVNGTLVQSVPKSVVLVCNRSDVSVIPNSHLRIQQVRKCCPRGQKFDVQHHECRISEDAVNDIQSPFLKSDRSKGSIYEISEGLPCKVNEYTVELTEEKFNLSIDGSTLNVFSRDGLNGRTFMPDEWCLEEKYGGKELLAQVCTHNCDSLNAYCVRKCCPPGQHFRPRHCGTLASACVPNDDPDVMYNISSYLDPLKEKFNDLFDVMGVRVGLTCVHKRYALNTSVPQDVHWMTRDAHLETGTLLTNQYCLEMFDRRDCPTKDVLVTAVLCFIPANPEPKDFRISFIIIAISSVCLALTLLVYIMLPELRNLHGQTLICHVSMMLLAFTCLARVQHSVVPDTNICTMLGYGIYFGFVAAFAWLNVMCFDIWWTFGSIRSVKPLRKSHSERRRFLWYSLYAWSVTILLTVTMYLLDKYPVSDLLDAEIGTMSCWFGSAQNTESDWPHYIFFVVPMGVVTCTNFILWLLTARHCAQVKSEVHRLQAGSVGDRAKKRFRIDRAKYVLTGKLWVVMGAGWVSELVSTLVSQPQWLWNIVDLINEMQGVFIFLILVVKPKLYYLIRKRLGSSPTPIDTRMEKPNTQNNATSSSGRTSSTFLSRTISSDERGNLRITPNNIKQI